MSAIRTSRCFVNMRSRDKAVGLPPVFDENSIVLILGSFPSVKSRETSFYYGHTQNRFWKMLSKYFNEAIPQTATERKAFILRHNIALWDMVTACDILGSADASVKNAEVADLQIIFSKTSLKGILLNGTLAYDLFMQTYSKINIPYQKMPSTSPANPRYDETIWHQALDRVFICNKRNKNNDSQK